MSMGPLTNDELREIHQELSHYADKRAACVETLKIVQRHRRWIDDEALQNIARLLDMTASELDGVATFYNLIFRRPVGRHVVHVCDSAVCWMMGATDVRQRLALLGLGEAQASGDDRFTCLPASCLGACHRAPVMVVDEDLYGGLVEADLEAILERYP